MFMFTAHAVIFFVLIKRCNCVTIMNPYHFIYFNIFTRYRSCWHMPYLMTPSKKQKTSQGFDFQPKQTNKQTSKPLHTHILPKSNLTSADIQHKLCYMYQKVRTVLQVTQQRGFVVKTAKCSF